MNTNISKGNWKVGNHNTVVTDNGEGFPLSTGHNDTNWYGGYLIAESILKPADANLIAAAKDLLEALLNIENDDGSIPDTIWKMRNAAVAKATGQKEVAG